MANICNFSMMVKGNVDNIKKFIDAMEQKGDIWMGRGAVAEAIDWDYSGCIATIDGWCKWSIVSSLVDNAISMERQRTTGNGNWYWQDNIKDVKEFLTLWQACKRFNVNMEVYSEELGCEFQEHFKYENGDIIEDCVDYREIDFEYYEDEGYSREGIEELLHLSITDEEWDDGYKHIGGYDNWDFDLEDVKIAA